MRKLSAVIAVLALATSALAVGTSHWNHTSEADFKAGTFHNVVATNLGDLKLSRAVKTLLGSDAQVSSVYALAEGPDGTVYAGTGPNGVLLAIKGEKVTRVVTLGENISIFSLLVDAQGRLLVGTGGDKGQILRIDPAKKSKGEAKPVEVFTHDGVQYVWAMAKNADGTVYAATGPEGQLFSFTGDGKSDVLFDSDENNLLSLVADDKDNLYVGTDPDGLVYRINRKTKEAFVVYDAAETEVTSLVLDKAGNLYAATAQASETPDTGEDMGTPDQVGRPEGDTGGAPITTEPPAPPNPSRPPAPAPGEPQPIPRDRAKTPAEEPKHLLILADDPSDPNGDPTPDPTPAPNKPGKDKPKPTPPKKAPTPKAAAKAIANLARANAAANAGADTATEGNAIYRIDKDGFVTELFRQPVMVHTMIEQNGVLLVGTGSEGLIYQVNPAAEETSVLAKVDPKEVVSLLAAKDGRVYMGLANSGDVATMTSGFATDGTFTSPVLDATQISRFGKIQLHGSLPKGTALTVATRSANVDEPSNPGWSKWSDETPATEFVQISSPPARFLQYRLSFKSDEGKDTPVVDEVDAAYQVPNLAPQIKSIKITGGPDDKGDANASAGGADSESKSAAAPGGRPKRTITWEASDPNEDTLQYTIYFRTGTGPWIQLKDKLTDPTYDWDTRGVADGRYEIKVTASDAESNPRGQGKTASRVSNPAVVDNTAPVIGDVKAAAQGNEARIDLRVVDRTSTVAALVYSVDSNTDWQTVLPSDKIADSPEEQYSFSVPTLSSGPHQITVRATDAYGNQAFEAVPVTIPAPTARLNN